MWIETRTQDQGEENWQGGMFDGLGHEEEEEKGMVAGEEQHI